MNTWEVIKYLIENKDSNKVFVSEQEDRIYDIYLDDYTKEFFIDERINGTITWIYKTKLSNIELSRLLYINNWR